MAASLEIADIVKSYGAKPVLRNLSFAAEPGEFVVLVGPSGCGKSTMLRSIAGLESIDSGAIKIGGRDVSNLAPKDRDIAMVFQDYALYPHKSVEENIGFGLRIRKVPAAEIKKKVDEVAEKLNLTPYLQRKPAELSGGQRQRVAIGRAIVRDPSVFLFDEPLSNLDAKLRGTMRQTIALLHQELGATAVYVTHDQVEAMTLADKIVVLDGGRIQQMGSPMDLYHHPSNIFVATFIGSPPMNILTGKLTRVGDGLAVQTSSGMQITIPKDFEREVSEKVVEGRQVKIGMRSENLKPVDPISDRQIFSGKVRFSERLGATTTVLFETNGETLTVTVAEPLRPKTGDLLDLQYRSRHLYLFDAESGENLLEPELAHPDLKLH